jgi:hypothetical protein
MLPKGVSQTKLLTRGKFHHYAASNAVAWFQFVYNPHTGLGRWPENQPLYLVTGCEKCPAWGNASYSRPPGAVNTSLKFISVGEGGAGTMYSWRNYGSAVARTGHQQHQPDSGTNPTFNQCVFVEGFRILLQPRFIRKLLGDKVVVEHGINPLHKRQGNVTPMELINGVGSIRGSSSWHGGSSGCGEQHPSEMVNEYHVVLEHISDASSVSFCLFRW